jgi:hypothetical protein
MIEIPATFLDFLKLIGTPLFLGIVISLLSSRWVWFVAQTNEVKFWLTGLVCIALPILSQAALTYIPQGAVTVIEAWWPAVVAGMGVWVTSQAWYFIFGDKQTVSKG